MPVVSGCPSGTASFSGGGILNAVVSGNLQVPGAYATTWSSPGFQANIKIVIPDCTIPGDPPITIPGDTFNEAYGVPPMTGNSTLTVVSAFGGTALSIPAAQAPAGCAASAVTGSNIGLANPLVTLSTSITCSVAGATINGTAVAKLVGAW